MKKTQSLPGRLSGAAPALFPVLTALVSLYLCEWIARGEITAQTWIEYFLPHFQGYLLAFLLLFFCWCLVYGLTRLAPLAVLVTGILACVPAAVNFYTLKLRGEPFLPWDLAQVGEAGQVVGAAGVQVQPNMIWSAVILAALAVLSWFVYRGQGRPSARRRAAELAWPAAALAALVFGVYLRPAVTQAIGIWPDAWMQDRYYRWYGVITGFMTNLQNLEIDRPDGYSEQAVRELAERTLANASDEPAFEGSYAAFAAEPEKTPTIIYVMDESYWDVTELEDYGVVFDTDISPNLHALQKQSAAGRVYSPSFGGGTCDVEFEAITGYSVSHLPSGSKPYQQHVTREMFALPNYLKARGYQTAAVHCFYAKYWSRSTAYPYLGLDEFISLEDMRGVDKVRSYYWKSGLVTDQAMGEQIIAQYEKMKGSSDAPVFLHAVTMQNHTNYNAANYADEDRVHVLEAPDGIDAGTLGALEDFATGVKAADELLGALTDYFSQVDEPVILVFWGDHYNPIGSNYDVFTATGYASGDSSDPALRETNLLIWSNYYSEPVELGVLGTYELTPVMMELYGLDMPVYYEYLIQQFQNGYRSRTAGKTVAVDGTVSDELDEEQRQWYDDQWMLQYDLMFGEEYLLEAAG